MLVSRRHPQQDLQLRPLVKRDCSRYLQAAVASLSHLRPWVSPPLDPEAFERYLQSARHGKGKIFLLQQEARLIGVFTLSDIRDTPWLSASVGYYALTEHHGEGLMQAGMAALKAQCFEEQGLHRLEALIDVENVRSIAFIKQAGFHFEGVAKDYIFMQNRWRDHQRWAFVAPDV